jgi:hypothetical protein
LRVTFGQENFGALPAFLSERLFLTVPDPQGKSLMRKNPFQLFLQGQDGFFEVSAPWVFEIGEEDAGAVIARLTHPAIINHPIRNTLIVRAFFRN